MPAYSHPHPHPYLPWQVGSLLPPAPRLSLTSLLPIPALLLAQVSKLDSGLVALKAEGQELLLELEKSQ